MNLLDKFKAFALKGNVIDLAVGVIIGTAFGKIVSSLVGDVIMPLLGAALNTVDFTKLAYTLPTFNGAGVVVSYGKFLQTLFDFLIIALVIFALVNFIDTATKKLKKSSENNKEDEKPLPEDIQLLTEIRDLLASNGVTQKVKTGSSDAKGDSTTKKKSKNKDK